MTFPNVSATFPSPHSETSTFPKRRFCTLRKFGNVETSLLLPVDGLVSVTFPNGRPVHARLHGGAVPCVERIVLAHGNVEP